MKVSGSYFEIGQKVGQFFREQIHNMINESQLFQKRLSWDEKNPNRVNIAVKMTELQFPQYLQEMRGIAQGAEIPIRIILILNFMHLPAVPDCSSLLIRTDNEKMIIHNEDHEWALAKNSYILNIAYPNGLKIIAHCYPGIIPGLSFAFTSNGLAMTCNYVPEPDPQTGIPRTIIGRHLLEAKTFQEAKEYITTIKPRSGGVNFNLASISSSQLLNIELTGDDFCITSVNSSLFHANHYSSEKFENLPIPDDFSIRSQARLEQGNKLLRKMNLHTSVSEILNNSLQILWDPIIHFELGMIPSGEKFLTLCTPVFRVDNSIKLEIYFHPENNSPKHEYSLADLG